MTSPSPYYTLASDGTETPTATVGPADPNATNRVKAYTVLSALLTLVPVLTVFNVVDSDQGAAISTFAQAAIGLAGAFGFAFVARKTNNQVKNGTFTPAPANPVADAFTSINAIKDHLDQTVATSTAQVATAVSAIQGAVALLPGGGLLSSAVTSGPIGDLLQDVSDSLHNATPVSLQLGSSGLMTSAWTVVMRRRYGGYALGRDKTPIKVDGYFGYDEEGVQAEYQRRTGQVPTGRVSDDDLHRLGLLPSLVTIHGTGQPDPMGIGYPADIARRLLHLYRWKPVGNYPASAVPMNHSADAGEAEFNRFVDDPQIIPGPLLTIDYSQGSICGGRVRNRIRAGKARKEVTLLGGVTFGNPMAIPGIFAGNVDPGGGGIDPVHETASEPGLLHMRAKGDLYTTCPDDAGGEIERAAFNAVFERFTGKDSVLEQIGEFIKNPFGEGVAAARAALRGGMFVARGTGPHVQYHVNICPGTNQTFYELGVSHLDRLATDRLNKIVEDFRRLPVAV